MALPLLASTDRVDSVTRADGTDFHGSTARLSGTTMVDPFKDSNGPRAFHLILKAASIPIGAAGVNCPIQFDSKSLIRGR